MLTTMLALLGAAALALVLEIAGGLVGEGLLAVLGPVLRPVGRVLRGTSSPASVAGLWLAALASYAFFPCGIAAPSMAVRTMALAAFMAATPLALMGTISLRGRRGRATTEAGRWSH